MCIHARFLAFSHIFQRIVCTQCYDRNDLRIRLCNLPYRSRRNKTVHVWHLDIHQYYLVKSFFRLGDFMYGVEPIYRRIDSDTGAADDL